MSESGFEPFFYSSQDGLKLSGRKYGWEHRNALPAVCLPGLTRNARDFHELALHLSQRAAVPRPVLVLEYRGRGRSEYDPKPENYTILTEAGDVLAGMTAAGLEHAAMIGTSRGGLIIMTLAAVRPGVMKAVVMNDIGPEIDGPGLVRIKTYVERAASSAKGPANWVEAAALIREISHRDFTAFGEPDWDRLARQIFREEDGKIVRDYDANLALQMKAIDLNTPIPALWPQFDGLAKIPLMVIRGANSDLLSAGTVAEMRRRRPDMRLVVVEGQGHAPDLGTDGLPEKIAGFLEAAGDTHRG